MTESISVREGAAMLLGNSQPAPEAPAEEKKKPAEMEAPETETEEPGGAEPEDTGDEGDDAEDTASDDEPAEEPEYEVDLDGEPRKVRFKELVDGWRRGQHYETKAERLRAKEQAVEQELAAATKSRTEYGQQLSALMQVLQAEDADLQKLKATDPTRYLLLKTEREEALKKVEAERQKVNAEQRQHELAAMRQRVETERAKLLAQLPTWRDPGKAKAEQEEITKYAKGLGFQDHELAGLTDSRAVIALRKAWLYDKGLQLKKNKASGPAKSVPAGKPITKAETAGRTVEKARAQLQKSGRVEDAVRLLLAKGKN